MKTNRTKLTALLLTLLILLGSLPAAAEAPLACENDQHVFMANAPSTESEHDGYCALCGAILAGGHVPGWIDNGDGTHSAGCAVCGYIAEGTDPEAHSADSTETVEATCTADGSVTVVCKCGATSSEPIPALGHDVDEGTVTQEPTCTADGEMTFTCLRCGQTATQPIQALGHDVDEGTVTQAPTASDEGVMTFACLRCGQTAEQPIPPTGEPSAQSSENSDPTLTAPGGCEHVYGDWLADEGGHSRTCTKCSGVESSDHTFDDDGVCTVCSYRRSTGCEHAWGEWTVDVDGHSRTCAKCSAVDSAAHSFGEPVVVTSATETSPGEQRAACTVCGFEKSSAIPAVSHNLSDDWTDVPDDDEYHHRLCLDEGCDYSAREPHAYDEGVETVPATAAENGVMTYTCSICGHQKTADIPALSHNWGEWTAVEGDHINHYKYCTDEGCALFYGAPHTWTESIVAPTCAAEGKLIRTCEICGDTVETVLEKAGHAWGEWPADGDQHTRTCTVCGEKQSASHNYGAYSFDADKDADHHFAVCADCGASIRAEHAWDEGAVVTAATPYTTGLQQYACTAEGCTASRFETLEKLTPTLTDRYLYFPVELKCAGSHNAVTAELAISTVDFGEIALSADGYYRVQRTLTLTDSWKEYFIGLAKWSGSHRLSAPADGRLTLSAVLTPENVWKTETVSLTFEDVADHFTVKFKSGDRVVETVIVKAGDRLGALPAVDDPEFLGWYYKNGTRAAETDAVSDNLTLYARYSYDVPKTGNNDHQLMLILLGVSGAMLVVMIVCAVQMIRLSKKRKR